MQENLETRSEEKPKKSYRERIESGELVASPDDPWGFFGKDFPSKHCDGKRSIIIFYDHTGAMQAECDCREVYRHDPGAITRISPSHLENLSAEQAKYILDQVEISLSSQS